VALGDVFKSKSARDRDKARQRRKAFRQAEGSLDIVKDRIKKLKAERDSAWQQARDYLQDGNKAASQRCLQTYRASELMLRKLDTKRWVFEQLLSKLELAKSDEDFAGALKAIEVVVNVDPEQVDDVLAEVSGKLEEQGDSDQIWSKEFDREMAGVDSEMTDTVPGLDDMEKQLQDEVAAEVGSRRRSRAAKEPAKEKKEADLDDAIGEARERLRKLMDDNK